MYSFVHGPNGVFGPCMQDAPKWSAFSAPRHGAAGWGAFQRNGPTGGAAKGMPLNMVTDPSEEATPATLPPWVLTTASAAWAAQTTNAWAKIARSTKYRTNAYFIFE